MPARLHFSNSLDALADRLITALTREDDPLAATSIATPGAALRDWLKIRIAEKAGVAAGLSFPHLENLLWERLAERDRYREAPDRLPARQLDAFSFQGLILSHLRHAPPAALKAYLTTDDDTETSRRLVQLSGRLASLFREYEYSRVAEHGRRALAESWMHGDPCFSRLSEHPDVAGLEQWQMEIYQALFRRDEGLRDRWGAASRTYRYTLAQYAEMVLGGASLGDAELPTPVNVSTVYHLFGLSNLSPFHRDLIGQLADETRLGAAAARFEIYALNPCAEFWEDALTDRERQARARKRVARRLPDEVVRLAGPTPDEMERGEIEEAVNENELLAQFGKPGRETIKLWCQLTGHDFLEDFRPPSTETVLATVRKSVLARLGPLPEPGSEEDETSGIVRVSGEGDMSLRLVSAPDARTELEAVRADMARLLCAQPELCPEDLALIPADPDAALPLIRAVFAGGREVAGNVPVLLPGTDTTAESPLLRGFRDLLSPSVRAGDRNAVLALLENPSVRRAAKLAPERLQAVRRFMEASGFQEGWGDEEEDNAGVNGLESTARAAEERAVLARVLDARDAGVADSGFWPAREAAELLERDESAAAIGWLSNLRVALRPFRATATSRTYSRAYSEWATLLRRLLDEFVHAEDDHAADRRAERELRAFCSEMEAWDLHAAPPDRVPGEIVLMLFEDAFRDPAAARTTFLRGGVRVGGLSVLRGLPFRHVWVTGLAAGTFPAPGEAAPLDLRGYRRLPGESDPAARDLYAFLEVIAATTDSLTLSWVRRDAAKDADVSPSRALTGLKAWVDENILMNGCELPIVHHRAAPLFTESAQETIANDLAWAPPLATDSNRIDWSHASEFLKNPAVHAAKVRFGLKPYDALDFDEDERAASLFLDRRREEEWMDVVRRAELAEAGSGLRTFTRLWDESALGGLLPPNPYSTVERERIVAEITGPLAERLARLRELLDERRLVFAGSLRVGPQDNQAAKPPVIGIPAFDLRPLGMPFELGGTLPWFFRASEQAASGAENDWAVLVEDGGEITTYVFDLCVGALRGQQSVKGDTEFLPAMLRGQGHLIVPNKKDKGGNPYAFYPLPLRTNAESVKILRALLDDLSQRPRFDDLPLHGIEAIRSDGGGTTSEEDWSEAIASWRRDESEKSFGGLKFWDRMVSTLRATVPADAETIIARRVAPFLDWKETWQPSKKKGKDGHAAGDATDSADGADNTEADA